MDRAYKIPLILLVVAIFGYLAKYVFNVFLARHLAHGLYGDFAIALRLLSTIGAVMLLGSDVSAKRFLVKYLTKNEHENTLAYMRWNIRLFSVTTIVTLVLAVLMILAMLLLHHYKIQAITEYHLAVYMLWLAPLAGVGVLASSYLLCNRNYVLASIFSRIGKYTLLLGFFAAVVFLISPTLNYVALVGTVCVVFLILSSLQTFAIVSNYPANLLNKLLGRLRATKEQQEEWMRCSINLVLNTVIFAIINLTDLLIVEIVGHTEIMVDRYAAALVISSILAVIMGATVKFIKPHINRLLSLKRKRDLQKMLHKFNTVYISIIFITVIIVCVFGKELLLHFGKNYVVAVVPLIILTVGYGIMAVSRTAISVLAFSGNEKVLLYSGIIALLLLVILCSIATYFWGILGTALATVLVGIVRAIYLIIMVRKRLGLRTCLLF